MHRPLALTGPGLDRSGLNRTNPTFLASLWSNPATQVLVVSGGRIPVFTPDADQAGLAWLSPNQTQTVSQLGVRCYLGQLELADQLGPTQPNPAESTDHPGRDPNPNQPTIHRAAVLLPGPPALPGPQTASAVIAANQATTPELPFSGPVTWEFLRQVGVSLAADEAAAATAAVALAAWHQSTPFCPRCGSPTEPAQAGWIRQCQANAHELFPRTDPVVIMRIHDGADRILLGHGASWGPGHYSLPAGFVEAGEPLEQAVIREVREETGVRVTDVRYLTSQPWPTPRSLMCGFTARALTTAITVDKTEVTDARWYSRADLEAAVADGSLILAPPSAIARNLIEDWLGHTIDAR